MRSAVRLIASAAMRLCAMPVGHEVTAMSLAMLFSAVDVNRSGAKIRRMGKALALDCRPAPTVEGVPILAGDRMGTPVGP